MQQVIYADVLFLIDMSMDFLALYIVSAILKLQSGKYKLAFASVAGSLYSVISVVSRHDSVILALAVAIVMNLLAFGLCKLSRLAVRATVFLVVNFILGGAMTAIFNVFNSFGRDRFVMIYGEISELPQKMPIYVFAAGFAITAVISVIFTRIFSQKTAVSHAHTEITYGKSTFKFKLLCDSGNLLTEPMSGDPVIFLSECAMKKLTGEDVLNSLLHSDPEFLRQNLRRARVILYETVNGRQSGICLRADKVVINGKNCRAWICVSGTVSSDNGDGILPVSLLT